MNSRARSSGLPLMAAMFCGLLAFGASAAVLYVDVNSTNPVSPYASWSTAATNIQDAADTAGAGDQVLVNDGVYLAGSRITADGATNRLAVLKALTLTSLNGAAATVIDGSNTVRCVYLTNGASLNGFSLNRGQATQGAGVYCTSTNAGLFNCQLSNGSATHGAGAWSGTLSNCTLSGNAVVFGGSGAGAYNSVLSYCTLSGNSTAAAGSGAGALGCILNNCTLSGNVCNGTGSTVGGGAASSTLNNCTLTSNSAKGAGASGGGAYNSTLNNCTLSQNSADYGGGGAYNCSLTNCTISYNQTSYSGGGVTGCTLYHCALANNNSGYGGGANYNCLIINSTITGNYASYGGGVYNGCTLYNCVLSGNTAGGYGGGAHYCTLNNCTLSGNTAQLFGGYGGGAYYGTLNNCIIYYNTGGSAGPDTYGSSLNSCCTPNATGPGCITNAPLFYNLGDFHLQAGSPCINAGTNSYVKTSTDFEGNLRIAGTTVDMGAYEYQPAGPLTVSLQASLTNVPVAWPVSLSGTFSKGQANSWNFGDGTIVSNQLSTSHTWNSPGDYPVVLTAYDVASPGGVSASLTIHVKTQIVYYVNAAGLNPVPPYDSWGTAATRLQDAIDAALPVPQSLVLATNGIYQAGGRVAYGSLTNRVVIDKPITVQSQNGPAVTLIQGNPVIGDSATRCAYVTNNAVLSGFTLAGGATRSLGEPTREQSGGGVWCEAGATVVNCVISNSAAVVSGGGIYGGSLSNCIVQSNSVTFSPGSGDSNGPGNGAGAAFCILNRCSLFDNVAANYGGGASSSQITNCILARNQALYGGGASFGALVNSVVAANSATWAGGGAMDVNPVNNCTLTCNTAGRTGGGVELSMVNNSILYYNQALSEANFSGYSPSGLSYCCTQPLPEGGTGNLSAPPQFTDSAHLSAGSPCRGAGDTNSLSGRDIDGQAWLNPPSIGCDEFSAGPVADSLGVSIQSPYTNVSTGFPLKLSALILGHATLGVWNFGDGARATNALAGVHTWVSGGDFPVTLTVYNDSHPGGVSATLLVHVVTQATHYVALNSPSPVAPYLSWQTAATNIQDAVDAGFGGATVLVSNGVYQTGGRVVYGASTNRLVIAKDLTVQSLNGPAATVIQGFQVQTATNGDAAVRCVYMNGNSALVGFTLAGGATRDEGVVSLEQMGGGVYCETTLQVLSNCVLVGSAAANSGGGAFQGTLNHRVLTANWALQYAGGVCQSVLNDCVLSNNVVQYNAGGAAQYSSLTNCTLSGNSGFYAGGADYCTLSRCLLSFNQASYGAGVIGGTLSGCILYSNQAAQWGGGAYSATLSDCLLLTNSAGNLGGGAISCELDNCTLCGNSAATGGGANSSTLNNSIAYFNSATSSSNYSGCTLNYCCTTPASPGPGNFTNAPLFANLAAGDCHLLSNSPCINAGDNSYAPAGPDLEGNPRVAGGTVDLGAYEFPAPTSVLSYAWAQQYGLATDGTADTADPDGDGLNNWQEWRAGTDPTSAASVLRILGAPALTPAALQLAWSSDSAHTYFLQRTATLQPPAFVAIATNLAGLDGTTTFRDSAALRMTKAFYRVGMASTGADTPPQLSSPVLVPAQATIQWSSVSNRVYLVARSTNPAVASSFSVLQSNIAGLAGTTTFTDTNAPAKGPAFYRVGVQP